MALVDAMQALLDCASEATGIERAFLTSGLMVSWDACECDGQLWVRLISQEAMTVPKMGMAAQHPCRRTWLVSLGIGTLRCAVGMSDTGELPSPAALTADAAKVIIDKDVLLDSAQCCLPAVQGVKSFALNRWDALGPDGGCVGGEWTLQMIVQTEDCAEPEPP